MRKTLSAIARRVDDITRIKPAGLKPSEISYMWREHALALDERKEYQMAAVAMLNAGDFDGMFMELEREIGVEHLYTTKVKPDDPTKYHYMKRNYFETIIPLGKKLCDANADIIGDKRLERRLDIFIEFRSRMMPHSPKKFSAVDFLQESDMSDPTIRAEVLLRGAEMYAYSMPVKDEDVFKTVAQRPVDYVTYLESVLGKETRTTDISLVIDNLDNPIGIRAVAGAYISEIINRCPDPVIAFNCENHRLDYLCVHAKDKNIYVQGVADRFFGAWVDGCDLEIGRAGERAGYAMHNKSKLKVSIAGDYAGERMRNSTVIAFKLGNYAGCDMVDSAIETVVAGNLAALRAIDSTLQYKECGNEPGYGSSDCVINKVGAAVVPDKEGN